ncbi:MAG: tetratricopeptide repeat protein [Thermotogae bacterium]|nr:tetratricopeptide repeat protein [Thermotogota bacterium]
MKRFILLLIMIMLSLIAFSAPNTNNQSGIELLASTMIEKIFGELNGNYVVGDPIKAGNMVLIPLCSVEVSFGGGLGGSPAIGGGGMGKVSVKPMGFLAIEDGKTRFIPLERPPQPQNDVFERALKIFDRLYPIIMQLIKGWQSSNQKPQIIPKELPEPPKSSKSLKIEPKGKSQTSESLEKARDLYKNGNFKDAYSTLEEYLKSHPNDINAHLLLAKVSAGLAQSSKGIDQMKYGIRAMKEFEKVTSLDPNNIEGLIGYGYAKLHAPEPLGSLIQAQKSFEKALKLDSNNINALLGLAETFKKMGFENKAKEYYRKVLELEPNNETAKKALENK